MEAPRLRRLDPADAPAFRALRLEALRSAPDAFTASWRDEAAKPLAWFADRLAGSIVFGAFDGAGALVGMAGFYVADPHGRDGVLWGLFVRSRARRAGIAGALVRQVIAHADSVGASLSLTVRAANRSAIALYRRAGFHEAGPQPGQGDDVDVVMILAGQADGEDGRRHTRAS